MELTEALCVTLGEDVLDELPLDESKGAEGVKSALALASAVALAVRVAGALRVGGAEMETLWRGVMEERSEGVVEPAGLLVPAMVGVAEPCDVMAKAATYVKAAGEP